MSKNFFFSILSPKEKRQKAGLHEGQQKLWVHLGPCSSDGDVELEEVMNEAICRVLCKLHINCERGRVGRLKTN